MKSNVLHSILSYALIKIAILYCCNIKLFSGKSILRLVATILVELLPLLPFVAPL